MAKGDRTVRSAKTGASLKRRGPQRDVRQRVLIICEGKNTEPYYFKAMKRCLKIPSADLEISDENQTCPLNLVKFAKRRAESARATGDPYDRVYCVFDQDSHYHYDDALKFAERNSKSHGLHAIYSVPSFEYWILLHFEDSARPYLRKGGLSPSDCVIADLKKHPPLSRYGKQKKVAQDLFALIVENQDAALQRAKKRMAHCLKERIDNPSTRVFELVEHLELMSQR